MENIPEKYFEIKKSSMNPRSDFFPKFVQWYTKIKTCTRFNNTPTTNDIICDELESNISSFKIVQL